MSAMKAISLWQPWASLWLSEAKVHETRHWPTPHRGPLLVHAAKKIVKDIHPDDELGAIVVREFGANWAQELPRGALVGLVELVVVVPTGTLPKKHTGSDDFYCGDFSTGRFGWRRGIYRRFAVPIPYRGLQSLFDVPSAVVAKQLAAPSAVNEPPIKTVLSFPGDTDLELDFGDRE